MTKTKRHEEDKIVLDFSKIVRFFDKYPVLEGILLLIIAFFTFYIRTIPDIKFLQAIDPYYIYRITLDLVSNGFVLPSIDTMRYYPDGFPPLRDLYALFYIYGLIYYLFFKHLSVDFLTYAKIIPPLITSLYVFIIYFISKEIFGKKYRWAGIFAGIIFATSNSVLFRSSEGFFEKEPISGLFILTSFLFFVKAIKSKSIIDGALAGILVAFAYSVWGGAVMLIYLYPAFAFLSILLGKWDSKNDGKWYVSFAFFYLLVYSLIYYAKGISFVFKNISSVIVFLSLLGVLFLYLFERKFAIREQDKIIFYPAMVLTGVFVLFILSLFVPIVSRVISSISRAVVYRKGVIESTVAENIPASVPYFLNVFGVEVFKNAYDFLFSSWFVLSISSPLFLYVVLRDSSKKYFAIGINILSYIVYYSFLSSQGENTLANIVYVILATLIVGLLIYENKHREALLYLFVYATLLAFVTKVRISYPAGMFVSILASFVLGYLFYFVIKNIGYVFSDKKLSFNEVVKVLSVIGSVLYVLSFVYINTTYAVNTGERLSRGEDNPLWEEALDFLKYNTSQDSVILSWWDFGYWFQTRGERKTLLDGGNQKGYRNVFAAKYFTGRYNETWNLLYLYTFRPTHILLDYTMIGKYAAMSKIANNGKWIDSYAQLSLIGNENNYLIYAIPGYKIYVPFTSNGTFDFLKGIRMVPQNINPIFVSQTPYIRYLCTSIGVFDLSQFLGRNNSYIEECIFIAPGSPDIAFLTFDHPNKKEGEKIFNSNFHKLYFEEGQRIPYVKQVFNNFLVKIYEVNYTYIEEKLKEEGISEDFINYIKESCVYRTIPLRECPLYYQGVDLS